MVFKVTVHRPNSPSGTGGLGVDIDAIFQEFNQDFFPDRESDPITFNPDQSVLDGIDDINAGIASNRTREKLPHFRGSDIPIIIFVLVVMGGILIASKAVN
jgi:hypothetical protein